MRNVEDNQLVISFLGDVTCDRPMLRAAKRADGHYDYGRSLAQLKPLFSESDFVVGNLETVCAGSKYGYNPGAITYNTPDEFIGALKRAGINVLTTANNHCLDMGLRGIRRTIQLLDARGILHTGTYMTADVPASERVLYLEKNGIRVAIAAFTAVMNRKPDGKAYSEEEWNCVNQLRIQPELSGSVLKRAAKKVLPVKWIKEQKANLDRKRGIPLVKAKIDNEEIMAADSDQIMHAISILRDAKSKADYVVACIHSGGQFNPEPGSYTKELFEKISPYADAIIGNHPHVIQKLEYTDEGHIVAYSLGSLNMSNSGDYVDHTYHPEYSAMLTLCFRKEKDGVSVDAGHTILHGKESDDGYLTVCKSSSSDAEAVKAENRFVSGKGPMKEMPGTQRS